MMQRAFASCLDPVLVFEDWVEFPIHFYDHVIIWMKKTCLTINIRYFKYIQFFMKFAVPISFNLSNQILFCIYDLQSN